MKRDMTTAQSAAQINTQAKSYGLEYMVATTQILTIMCLIKGHTAWTGRFP